MYANTVLVIDKDATVGGLLGESVPALMLTAEGACAVGESGAA